MLGSSMPAGKVLFSPKFGGERQPQNLDSPMREDEQEESKAG